MKYQERVVVDRLFTLDDPWNAQGAHHFTICEFLGKTVIATDGKHADFFLNRVASGFRGPLRKAFAARAMTNETSRLRRLALCSVHGAFAML